MGKLRPWEENCHAANKYTQLRQNFPRPASSPLLFLLRHNLGEAGPWPGPSLVHSSGPALLQCTDHRPPGCEGPETTTQRKTEAESEMLLGSTTRIKEAAEAFLNQRRLIFNRSTPLGPASKRAASAFSPFLPGPSEACLPQPTPELLELQLPLCWFGTWYRLQQRHTLGWREVVRTARKAKIHTA